MLTSSILKVYRVGILNISSPSATTHLHKAFELGLREHGYIDGQNITLERRSAEGSATPARLVFLSEGLLASLTHSTALLDRLHCGRWGLETGAWLTTRYPLRKYEDRRQNRDAECAVGWCPATVEAAGVPIA